MIYLLNAVKWLVLIMFVLFVFIFPLSGYPQQTAADPAIVSTQAPDMVEEYLATSSEPLNSPTKESADFEQMQSAAENKINDSKPFAANEKISLDLKGIDIIELLRMLSLKTGLTIVASKKVSGRVSLFLNNVTFEDILDILLVTQDLAYEQKGDIIMVMTASEYKARYGKDYDEQREFKSFKLAYAKPQAVFKVISQIKSDIGKIIVDEATGTIILVDIPEKNALMAETIKKLDQSLKRKVFELKFAKAKDMAVHLEKVIIAGTGQILVDEPANKVIVTELADKMLEVEQLIREFDQEQPEVFIEAEICQISLRNEFQRGINWQTIFENLSGANFVGSFPVAAPFSPSPSLDASSLSLEVGTLDDDNYVAAVKLLESYGDVKLVSRPKIAVVNNQEAKILVGSREAYITQTLSQGQSTTVTSENIEFIDVGIKLKVVPTVNPDGIITMSIKPEISSVRESITTSLGSRVPILETSEAETVVKVKDGKMIIIGGLLKEESRDGASGIPWLYRLPFIKALFGSYANSKRNTELVILLTPRIISGRQSMLIESSISGLTTQKGKKVVAVEDQPVANEKNSVKDDFKQKLKGPQGYN